MAELKYSKDHEWVQVENDLAVVGISDYAQEQLGDVVFVDLPEIGTTLEAGAEAAVVESVKAASEVYSPVSGEVTEVNEDLQGTPGLVNEEAEAGGWFFKVRLSDTSELDGLMDESAYKAFVEGLE